VSALQRSRDLRHLRSRLDRLLPRRPPARRRSRRGIEYLNGEIIRLGEKHGVATPCNARVRELIRQAEQAGKGSPCYSADTLATLLNAAA
jgi:hypothetical protein